MPVGLTPKGCKMPDTKEEWLYLTSVYEKRMIADKQLISKLKSDINTLRSKIKSPN